MSWDPGLIAIVHEVIYPHPPERVWRALTARGELAAWLASNDFEPRVGHRFSFQLQSSWPRTGRVACRVVEVQPPRRLVYTWNSNPREPTTYVTFALEPVGRGTRLRLEHAGFGAEEEGEKAQYRDVLDGDSVEAGEGITMTMFGPKRGLNRRAFVARGGALALAGSGLAGLPGAVRAQNYDYKTKSDGKLTIGFSQVVMNHPFRIANVESLKATAAAMPDDVGELIVTDAQGDVNKEIANVESLIARGVDAIIVSSLSGKAVYPAYREVAQAEIPLIIFASGVPDEEDVPYVSYVATDEVAMGERAADYVGNKLQNQGNLVIIDGVVESTNSILRSQGFMPQIEQYWTGVNVVARQSGQWLRLPATEVMTSIIQANPDINAVFAQNDEMALGAVDALSKAGRTDGVFVVGMDAQKEALQAIKEGILFDMTIKNEWNGTVALETAVKAARGEKVPQRVVLNVPMVNDYNLDLVYDPESIF